MREVNMDGIEVDDFVKSTMRALKNFKQGALLENSLFTASYRTSPEIDQLASAEQVQEMINQELMNQLAKGIIETHKGSIEVTEAEEFPGVKNHKLQLVVLPIENLKHIVEYCIRQIPEEALSKIRKN